LLENKCSSKEKLVSLDLSKFIVIEEFQQEKKIGNNNLDSFIGSVFTSRRMIQDVELSTKLQPHGLRLMSDGTYKLVKGGYCILITGTIEVKVTNSGDHTQSFRPFLFALASSENTEAYTALFQALRNLPTWAFEDNVPIKAPVHIQDRCDATRNAFIQVFHDNQSVENFLVKPCYVHLLRNIMQSRSKMLRSSFYDEVIRDMDNIHKCK